MKKLLTPISVALLLMTCLPFASRADSLIIPDPEAALQIKLPSGFELCRGQSQIQVALTHVTIANSLEQAMERLPLVHTTLSPSTSLL